MECAGRAPRRRRFGSGAAQGSRGYGSRAEHARCAVCLAFLRPTALPLAPTFDDITVIALAIVHAEDATTPGALIPLRLVSEERGESLFSKLTKVADQADIDVLPVSSIQVLKSLTGKLPALKAES